MLHQQLLLQVPTNDLHNDVVISVSFLAPASFCDTAVICKVILIIFTGMATDSDDINVYYLSSIICIVLRRSRLDYGNCFFIVREGVSF